MENYKIGAVIVTYNNFINIRFAIESVFRSDYKNIDILVVDNGSNNTYREKLSGACKEEFSTVEILYLHEKCGYGEACNKGAQYFIDKGFDALLFLNNDVVLDRMCISHLVRHLNGRNVALIGPKVYRELSNMFYSTGGFFNKKTLMVKHRGNGEIDVGRYDKTEKVEFINGCAFVILVKPFIELGGFDKKFYYYADETDLCYRLTKAGYSIIYEPKAIVYHWPSTTLGGTSKRTLYYMSRSRLYFVKKHGKNNGVILYNLFYIFYMFIIKLSYERLGQIITRWLAVVRGVKDFFVGTKGKGPYDKF